MARTKKYRWKSSRNTVGRDQEIQMLKFKKSRWQGSRIKMAGSGNSDGNVQKISMARIRITDGKA
jgi:hypothetical protein